MGEKMIDDEDEDDDSDSDIVLEKWKAKQCIFSSFIVGIKILVKGLLLLESYPGLVMSKINMKLVARHVILHCTMFV